MEELEKVIVEGIGNKLKANCFLKLRVYNQYVFYSGIISGISDFTIEICLFFWSEVENHFGIGVFI